MFDWLKKLFGNGVIYFECKDAITGTVATGKMNYIGEYNEPAAIKGIKEEVYSQTQRHVTDIVITNRTGY